MSPPSVRSAKRYMYFRFIYIINLYINAKYSKQLKDLTVSLNKSLNKMHKHHILAMLLHRFGELKQCLKRYVANDTRGDV